MYAIKCQGLTKHYNRGKIKALTNFSVELEKGVIYCLLGPNGAGKTTCIKAILGIVNATAGEVEINGISFQDPKSRNVIGYLSETHKYLNFLNGEQVLYYYGKMNKLPDETLKPRILELLEFVGLKDKGTLNIKKYSKGMLQRLGIAQSLINNPEILFLDEPTDGIDPVGRKQIRDILLKLKKEGKTIFINSHLLSEVEKISDFITILKGGEVLVSGKPDELTGGNKGYLLSFNSEEEREKCMYSLDKDFVKYEKTDQKELLLPEVLEENLNSILSIIVSDDIKISSVVPDRSSLEEYFINIIT